MIDLQSLPNQGPKTVAQGSKGACSSSHPLVSETMLAIMKAGGNAMDAGIAGSLVQATVEPHMTNHGGSVIFLCYHAKTDQYYQLSSTGTVVSGLARWSPLPKSMSTGCAAIPGYMPGLGAIYQRFGSKPWSDLCQPAIEAAQEGYPMYSWQYGVLTETMDSLTYFPSSRELFLPNGFLTPVGQLRRNPALAQTMQSLAQEGPAYFTHGTWAENFVKTANDLGWKIELDHMSAIPPRWHQPLSYEHEGNTVVQLAPPEQAGVLSQFLLGILRHAGMREMGHYTKSAESLYVFAHALRWVLWEMSLLQDPELFSVPLEQWRDDQHHQRVARIILDSRPQVDLTEHVRLNAGKGGMQSMGLPPAETDSCELSITDAEGNWVQLMHSGQAGGMPAVAVDGVFMHGSAANAHMQGLTGWLTGAGRIKCIVGSTIVAKDGKPWMTLGTPGRPHLTVPQVLHNILDFGMDPYEASLQARFWPLADDYTLEIENRIDQEVVAGLARMGIQIKSLGTYKWNMGSFQICWQEEDGTLKGSSDPRRVGEARAF